MTNFRNIRDEGIIRVPDEASRLLIATEGTIVLQEDDFTTWEFLNGIWNQLSGGSGGNTYAGASPTTLTVGGIPSGTAILGLTYDQLWEDLLVPYINPAWTAFAITQTNPVEVGTTISGSKSFPFTISTSGNVQANTLSIIDVTAGNVAIATGLPITSPASANIGSVQLTAPGSYSWKGRATNTHSATFDSSNTTVNWYWRLYYGISANTTLTEAQIEALSSSTLVSTKNATYAFAATNYKYFSWADSLGSPTASTGFKDTATNLAVAMADSSDDAAYSNVQNGWSYALVSVTNTNGITTNYRVYRTKNTLGSTINIQVS
jgi:hypothetical protein